MDESTLAYVAGAIDLLGLIRIRDAAGTPLPVVQMHGDHMHMLEFLGELTGTKAIVVRRSYTRAGCSIHCKEKHQHVVSVSGRWSLTGAKATVVLWNIRPYLRIQAEKADAAIAVGLRTNFKPGTLRRMTDLGWVIPEFGVSE